MAADSEEHETGHSGPDQQQSQPAGKAAGDEEHGRQRRQRKMPWVLPALIALLLIAGLMAAGILPRIKRQKKITTAATAIRDDPPVVNVITAQQAPAGSELELPGNIEALQVATISAQTSGYLLRWHADIGDRVKAGQLLAEIDTPTVDQDLQQARANLVQSRASLGQAEANLSQAITNMEFARVSWERWQYLAKQHVVSDQDRDQTLASYNAAKAAVDAMQANINAAKAAIAANEASVRRSLYLQGFKRIFAPFTGIITARNVEVGSLIAAGAGTGVSTSTGVSPSGGTLPGSGTTQTNTGASAGGGGLFQIARIDILRIFISVPQTFVTSVEPGQTAEINVREFPQNVFTGRVVRTTSALDQASRTLLTDVRIRNPGYQLMPGMYATVKFDVSRIEPPVQIPATALIIRAEGPQVATVSEGQKLHYQKVVIGRDYGNKLDISSGLKPGATLVVNIADGLQEGTSVRTQPAQTNQQTNQQAGQQTGNPQQGQSERQSGN